MWPNTTTRQRILVRLSVNPESVAQSKYVGKWELSSVNKILPLLITMTIALLPAAVYGGTASISAAGAKNMGSVFAYVYYCEKDGFLPVGTTPELLFTARDSFTIQAYEMVKKQYQESLHEKKLFSIAKDAWFSFEIDSTACSEVGEVLPTMIATLKKANR